jgi:hypothetical protein
MPLAVYGLLNGIDELDEILLVSIEVTIGRLWDALNIGNCLARLKQQNYKDREDRKDTFLRGLCGLRGSNDDSKALFGICFSDG